MVGFQLMVGLIGVVVFAVVAIILLFVIAAIKDRKIIKEVFKAQEGDMKGKSELGFYPPEKEGTFGKKQSKRAFEDDGSVDTQAFMLSDDEKEKVAHESSVEYREAKGEVKEYTTIADSMVSYQRGSAAQAQHAQGQPPQTSQTPQPTQAPPIPPGPAQAPPVQSPNAQQPAPPPN